MHKFVITALLMVMVALPAVVQGAPIIPDPDLSFSLRTYAGPETAVLFVLPSGDGFVFSSASIGSGVVDATITLTVMDAVQRPMPNYPAEDLWLESADGGLVICDGGSIADVSTDEAGQTRWHNPLRAGGFSQTRTIVMISGLAVQGGMGELVTYNSADINGDLVVNLSDVPIFAADFHSGENPFRSDFRYDGFVNLSDVVLMGQSLGLSCP